MIPLRSVAQRLHDCIQVELHRGNLAAAHADLLTLLRLVRLHEDGWTLVNQMIRTAILGLATDTVWDALQAPGWTDEQLQSFQSELEQIRIVPQLPRTWEVMRIGALMEMDQYLRDGPSSQAWRWQFLTGTKRPAAWIEYSAFILWRVAHSGRDRLLHLKYHQAQIDRLRALASGVPFVELPPPPQPEVNWWNRTPQANGLFPFSQIPNFVRAVETVLGNDTQRRLAIAAVALERHRLHHGQYPESPQALVPEVLDAVPHDPISGESLRYHRDTDRAFTLEAVGFGPRTGTDLSVLVWPRAAAPSESAQ